MTEEERTHWRVERGLEIYHQKLASILEPEHDGEVVAIDVESGEWAVRSDSMHDAEEALGAREGRQIYFHRVGRRALARMGWFGR